MMTVLDDKWNEYENAAKMNIDAIQKWSQSIKQMLEKVHAPF
jgi:hypothetical protein